MLKLLGGIGKGLSLFVPKNDLIRPTSVLLKRRLFDKYQSFSDTIFVDGCAGAGAIGLEAWSRGCQKLYLVETNKKVFGIMQKNVERIKELHSEEAGQRPIISKLAPVERWLRQFQGEYSSWSESERKNCIFFLDPPYQNRALYEKVISNLKKEWFVGKLWIESDQQKGLPISYWDSQFSSYEQLEQGSRYIIIAHQ